jgi:hypothetical protein
MLQYSAETLEAMRKLLISYRDEIGGAAGVPMLYILI